MSFWELFVIGVIALVVLGPERLPKAARTVGLWVGKAKQGFNSIKTEIDRELKVKELQQQIEAQKKEIAEQSGLDSLNEAQQPFNQIMDDVKAPVEELNDSIATPPKDSKKQNDQQSAAE